jgi:hypothetical protein
MFFGSFPDQKVLLGVLKMARFTRMACLVIGFTLISPFFLAADLWAFTITEKKIFKEGPYSFQMEVQIKGSGSLKKKAKMTSLKVKIKNGKASSDILRVKAIRNYTESKVLSDIETRGYPISPGQWVTKYYRLPKKNQPFLGEKGYVEIAFENFVIQFMPRGRKFQGPMK